MAAVTIDDFQPLLAHDNVVQKKALGMPGLFVNGNMFLAVAQEVVMLKLDGAAMEQASVYPGVRPSLMKGWVELPFTSGADFLRLAELARDFVAALPPKAAKKKAR
jgi:TfoX/Sxy family transcriptional regulator of competence genes